MYHRTNGIYLVYTTDRSQHGLVLKGQNFNNIQFKIYFFSYKHFDVCAAGPETTYRVIQTMMTRDKKHTHTHTLAYKHVSNAAYNDFTINNNILPRIDLP